MHFLFHHRHKEPAARVDLGPPTSEVILRCPPESKVKPRPPPSEEDKASAHELRAYVDEYVKHHPCGESYAAYEEKWRSNESLYFRYLRAVHGDMKQSKKRILVCSTASLTLITGNIAVAPRVQTGAYSTGRGGAGGFDWQACAHWFRSRRTPNFILTSGAREHQTESTPDPLYGVVT